MPTLRRLTLFTCFVLALVAAPGVRSEAPAAGNQAPMDRPAVEGIIREYILAHPEVIVEAVSNLREREKAEEARKGQEALVLHRERFQGNGEDALLLGNPQGDRVLVEFLDYACGYCKAAEEEIRGLIKADSRVKLVVMQFPILGPGSVLAAKAAMASKRQGKFAPLHLAFMGHRGAINEDVVMRLARSVGLDTEVLKRDMDTPAIRAMIEGNMALAGELGINGTPAFIAGGKLIPGVVDSDSLKKLLAAGSKG